MINITKVGIRSENGPGTWAEVLLDPGLDPSRGPSTVPTPWDIEYARIPVDAIVANPRQPRQVFDDEALEELAASIAQVGLLQPIVVRHSPHEPVDSYELVAGERRLRSVRQLGWKTVPAVIRVTEDSALLRDALLENLQRAELNPLEEAAAYQQLLADFGCTHEELSTRIGRSRPHISNTIRLLKLPPAVQRRVAAGVLSQGHARALLSLPDQESMESLATRIVSEGLSVRTVEEIVSTGDRPPAKAKPRRPPIRRSTAGLEPFAEDLSERLDTRVMVTMGRSKGRVTIEFAGIDDLERILDLLAPGGSLT